jgi:hypothetical protein
MRCGGNHTPWATRTKFQTHLKISASAQPTADIMRPDIDPKCKRQGLSARSTIAEDTVQPNQITRTIEMHCLHSTAASDNQLKHSICNSRQLKSSTRLIQAIQYRAPMLHATKGRMHGKLNPARRKSTGSRHARQLPESQTKSRTTGIKPAKRLPLNVKATTRRSRPLDQQR